MAAAVVVQLEAQPIVQLRFGGGREPKIREILSGQLELLGAERRGPVGEGIRGLTRVPDEANHLSGGLPPCIQVEIDEAVDDPGRHAPAEETRLEENVPSLPKRQPIAALPEAVLEFDEGLDLTE